MIPLVLLVAGAGFAIWNAADAVYFDRIWNLYDGRSAVAALCLVLAVVFWILRDLRDDDEAHR